MEWFSGLADRVGINPTPTTMCWDLIRVGINPTPTTICWDLIRVGINPTPTNPNEMIKLALMG